MASLKDISKICGVSVATVSKALNNHKDIGEDTKKHIRQVAKEIGYSPNLSARALKTNRTYEIGVLFMDDALSGLTHDYFSRVLDSFKRAAEKSGYDITFINACRNREGRMSYLEHCRYRGFDGVMLACIDVSDPEVIELVQSNIPLVTIDYLFNNRIAVISDNVTGMRELLEYIYGKGHRKVAYIHGAKSAVTDSRLTSFYNTAEKLGMEVPEEYIGEAAYRNTEDTYQVTTELLNLQNPPTCIIFPDDFAAFGGINAIRDRGLRIPEDVSVAGYDGINAARHIQPSLTTIRQDTEQMGCVAARELISLIERPKTTIVEQIVIPGNLIEGQSVAEIN
ncbi:MAG: LacI family transcriptional regulator [Bacteroidales bacterium]|nr:LacI family transcriptional regulator [Lachnoclostridium sp.]MCM1384597.1 LacI family transcriptional regulator [Lachnoclostridium sp.]MCM1465121.1 LacI family transcriptional regulator [Bacteroidales bacterium]